MKNGLLKSIAIGVLVAGVLGAGVARADMAVTIDPAVITNGYMNVFEIPANGGGFLWGSGWGIGDLTAVYSGTTLTLGPNCIGDANPYWYIGGGGPGAQGNKVMEANLYAEPAGSLPGQLVVFTGTVASNTLASSHHAYAFIKDFAPDFSSFVSTQIPIPTSGSFSISLNTINDPLRHVQWGFQVVGPCVWVTDLAPYGTVVLEPFTPTPATTSTWGRVKKLYR